MSVEIKETSKGNYTVNGKTDINQFTSAEKKTWNRFQKSIKRNKDSEFKQVNILDLIEESKED